MAVKVSDQYVSDFLPGRTAAGAQALTIICKRSYRIDEVEAVAVPLDDAEQAQLYGEAQLYDDAEEGGAGSVRLDSDYHPFKHKVDVNIVGRALAPHGKPVAQFDVFARIGNVERTLRIVGPRFATFVKQKKGTKKKPAPFTPPKVSSPEPITEVPLRFEYAFGGNAVFIPPDEEAYEEAMAAVEEQQQAEKEAKEEAVKAAKEKEQQEQLEEAKREFFSEHGKEDYFTQSSADGAGEGEEALSKIGGDGTQVLTREDLVEVTEKLEQEEQLRQQTMGKPVGEVVVSESALDVHEVPEPDDKSAVSENPSGGTQVLNLKEEGEIRLTGDDWTADAASGVRTSSQGEKEDDDDPFADYPRIPYPQNPVGMGLIVCRDPRVIEDLPLPLIEHPDHPIEAEDLYREMQMLLEPGPVPGSFGIVGGGWEPRSGFAGVPEEHLEKMEDQLDKRVLELDPENEEDRAELEALLNVEPPLFQGEWYNSAVMDWQLDRLDGNEEFVLRNMTENGTLYFKMPGDRPRVQVDRGRGLESVQMRLDTCCVLVDELQVQLVWRGHLAYSGPDELAEYPKLELVVTPGQWREDAPAKSSARREGGTQVLDLSELESLEESIADSEEKVSEAAMTLDDARDAEGTLREDKMGDVRHSDDGWVQETLDRMDSEQETLARQADRTEREERKEKVESVRERMAEIAAEEAKQKKKKPKKKD